jgi:DNA repair exonuclease SbcCD nuclease subunit
MRIGISGDFHFGFNGDAAPQARSALAELAKDCDAVICSGDLFDSRVPRQETLDEAIRIFSATAAEMRKAYSGKPDGNQDSKVEIGEIVGGNRNAPLGCPPIIAIHGTHERRSRGLVNPVQLLDSAKAFANAHGRKIEISKGAEKACIQGMGGVPEEFARAALKKMDFRPVAGALNIFVFHQSLDEAIPYGGDTLCAADLPDGFDLYVNGHIHWASEMREGGRRIIMAGSTVVTQMRAKEAAPKTVAIFDTVSKKVEFRQIPTRAFVLREIKFDRPMDPDEIIEIARAELSKIHAMTLDSEPLVKIKLSGNLAPGFLPSNVDVSPLLAQFGKKMRLFIDRDLESPELGKCADAVRQARGEGRGVRELALSLLLEALKGKGVEIPIADLEEMIDLLSEGNAEGAANLM